MAPEPWTDPYAVIDERSNDVAAGTGVAVAVAFDAVTGEVLPVVDADGAMPSSPGGFDGGGDLTDDDPLTENDQVAEHGQLTEHDRAGLEVEVGGVDALADPTPPPVPGFGQDVLNPAQQEVVDLLGATSSERPEFDAELRHHLRAELEAGLEPLLELLTDDDPLFVSKYPLSQIHGCEDRFLADRREAFSWSPSKVRGTVSHKAVELSLHWESEPVPLELVDEAMARLTFGSGSLADWLQAATPVERAEVRAESNERVSMFLECFPPLKKAWRPVTESPVRVELFDRRIILSGRVDLTLGRPRGTTANKVLIDFKSGRFSPSHVDDLRFYALLEAIRMGTPPRMLATYYLDSGRPFPEAVTPAVLDAALHRTIDGATRMAHLLHTEAAPVRRTGPSCRWCPLLSTCADGQAHLRALDDDDTLEDL